MSSTRRAKDDSTFHQNRYASSPEFERGLLANLVAKRCTVIDDPEAQELIWFIHYLSWQPGGLESVAADLLVRFAARLGTPSMLNARKEVCNAETVAKIRLELPKMFRRKFPLRGETYPVLAKLSGSTVPFGFFSSWDDRAEEDREQAASYPQSYPLSSFIELCQLSAEGGLDQNETGGLKEWLERFCLDPAMDFDHSAPWYFPGIVAALREYQAQYMQAKSEGVVTTELGQKVCDALDYTFRVRGLTLIEGQARRGKSFAAENWCQRHPGRARFVEVPYGNDDASFFRGLARGLGLGGFQQYKICDIRERVESVLLTGQISLVLDEAQRLWPQMNMRYGTPKRITWLMSMANRNVPICLIATPQFMELQKASAEKNQWNSAQLAGRFSHYESLPASLSRADLVAVAGSMLPGVDATVLRAVAGIASLSPRYLGAIRAAKDRANDYARQAGREHATAADVRKAVLESVTPSDNSLVVALEAGRKGSAARIAPTAPQTANTAAGGLPGDSQATDLDGGQEGALPPRRGASPEAMTAGRRSVTPLELVKG